MQQSIYKLINSSQFFHRPMTRNKCSIKACPAVKVKTTFGLQNILILEVVMYDCKRIKMQLMLICCLIRHFVPCWALSLQSTSGTLNFGFSTLSVFPLRLLIKKQCCRRGDRGWQTAAAFFGVVEMNISVITAQLGCKDVSLSHV